MPLLGQNNLPKILYIGDPMCSWCYGISEQLTQLQESNVGHLQFELVVGGLRPGGGDKWDEKFTDFLRDHWKEVSQKSGLPINYNLLDSPAFNYDTEPSCRAVAICKVLAPTHVFDFFKEVQRGFYVHNQDPKDLAFYQEICKKYGIPWRKFAEMFTSQQGSNLVLADFNYARRLGINSFPTLLLVQEEQITVVARGYATKEQMQSKINTILNR